MLNEDYECGQFYTSLNQHVGTLMLAYRQDDLLHKDGQQQPKSDAAKFHSPPVT